ncbi:MAG: histone deacetylase family protein [Rhodospirillaceae bacterium]|jgi:acetoin utilization deacetylase AcuC-like enzyme|nr:histone deacetylase family protein [Rhodospirillaceae bacterium]MBT5080449.1 histone deacetylase family protein [Rhodospirillaceae bacterium]MBT5523223.1 histone deacetylase family protein [Rhodospirillaceae bacterium]MBT5879212.1 histone deacetylase family protein [Rhodospirillaceae bacterium]MBT6587816.1 histone deacetylase family protein [Rhodospirillaceae bacterium]
MRPIRVVHSPAHAGHDPESFIRAGRFAPSPECPERAHRLFAAVEKAGYEIVPPQDHGMDAIAAVHPPDYLDFLQNGLAEWQKLPDAGPNIVPNMHPGRHMQARPQAIVGKAGYYMADTGCPIGPGTWGAVASSAQVALTAADLVLGGDDAAYALCRPPGHHAYGDQAGGFCFLNNVAIAAQYMRGKTDRVAILDVDVHHGNGTQGIFYDRGDVLFCSLHGEPSVFYPYYAGYGDERGTGAGEGFNLNLPQAPGTADDAYLQAMATALQAIKDFAPGYLLVSLGLDAQENDPLGILSITTQGFSRMAADISALGLPTLIVQEGGYLCDEIEDNLLAFLSGFEAAR